MTCVLSSLFCADLNQPSMIKGDFTVEKPAMALLSLTNLEDEVMKEASIPEKLASKIKRIFTDKMALDMENMTMSHLKPIYVYLHFKQVISKKMLINEGAIMNVLSLKQMKRLCRTMNDLISNIS